MPTKDGFDPDHSLPSFLVDRTGQRGIGNVGDTAVGSSRALKAGILIAIATAAGIAASLVADPAGLVADVTASLVGNSERQPAADPSPPTLQSATFAPALMQSVADAETLPAAAKDAPTDAAMADSDSAVKDQADKSEASSEALEPSSEALFRQFEAWAATQDAQPRLKPAQAAQDDPAQLTENAGATQKRRRVRPVENARAETRPQNLRQMSRRTRAERPPVQAQRRPIQDARAQGQPAQDAQAPSFLPVFGQRN